VLTLLDSPRSTTELAARIGLTTGASCSIEWVVGGLVTPTALGTGPRGDARTTCAPTTGSAIMGWGEEFFMCGLLRGRLCLRELDRAAERWPVRRVA
jgi:hypothetical protein